MTLTNTFVGFAAGCNAGQDPDAENSTAIGANSYTTASNQIVLGDDQVTDIQAFGVSMFKTGPDRSYFFAPAGNLTLAGGANIGVGESAMAALTTGTNNVAVGDFAMNAHQSGTGNVAVGSQALKKSVTCTDCTVIGFEAGRDATYDVGLTAMGRYSCAGSSPAGAGTSNTGFGDSTLRFTTTGGLNVAMGYRAGESNVAGTSNVFIGAGCAVLRTGGDQNVAVGESALGHNATGGNGNVAIGYHALYEYGGQEATGVGHQALTNATGIRNVALGTSGGGSLTTGTLNTHLGFSAGAHASQKVDAQNSIAIGANTFTTADNQVVIGDANVVETVLRGVLRCATYTVAALPSAATMGAGARAFVTDATASTFASTVAGGGSTKVPVYSDGTNWKIG